MAKSLLHLDVFKGLTTTQPRSFTPIPTKTAPIRPLDSLATAFCGCPCRCELPGEGGLTIAQSGHAPRCFGWLPPQICRDSLNGRRGWSGKFSCPQNPSVGFALNLIC